jgi:hypothetical protein
MTSEAPQSRSLFRTFQGLLILGLVMVLISFLLPYRPQSLALAVALALVAMVLASVSAYGFYRFLLPTGQCSFLHIALALSALSGGACSISLEATYERTSLALSLSLAVAATVLALISVYVFFRFLRGRGPGTYSDTVRTRRNLTIKT